MALFSWGGALGTLGLTPADRTLALGQAGLHDGRAEGRHSPGTWDQFFIGSFMNLFSKCLLGTPRCLDPAQSWGWWILASGGM